MREVTERPEALEAGTITLVGTDRQLIVDKVSGYIDDPETAEKCSRIANPYGDGNACKRIISKIASFFSI